MIRARISASHLYQTVMMVANQVLVANYKKLDFSGIRIDWVDEDHGHINA